MDRSSSHPPVEAPQSIKTEKRIEAYFSNPFLMNLSQKSMFTMFKHKVQLWLSVVLHVFAYKAKHYTGELVNPSNI